jgi:Mn-dependent DtxR family transcriptional regulator
MRKVSTAEQQFLSMIANIGGSHCFGREDKVTAEAHKMLRSLDRRGLVSVEPTDDGPLVTITEAGKAVVNG